MTTSDHLIALIRAIPQTNIVVIGDIMLDRFVRGDVHRISPESPVPVLTTKQENRMIGGAGNVLANLHSLKARCAIIGLIGDDQDGQIVKGLIEACGAPSGAAVVRKDTPTTIKTRFLAGHQQLLRVDTEVCTPLDAATEKSLIDQIERYMETANAIILSDYGKGVLSDAVIGYAISSARKKNIPVLVDPKGSSYAKYCGATVVTPNRKELSEATGNAPTTTDTEVVEAAEKMLLDSGILSTVATRSQDGMTVIEKKKDGNGFERPIHLRTRAKEVFDVSGAGDTVIATIAAIMAAGGSLQDGAAVANIAGGIVVGKVGTAAIREQELIDALMHEDTRLETTPSGSQAVFDRTRKAPVLDWNVALEETNRWRAKGLKIGFTNGCFDLLHAGHVNYLNDARQHCDRLILGLNTDQSVRLLKGPTRPVNHQDDRATVISALGAVDMVIFFGAETAEDDQTASALIRHLKPDTYFKGADYTLDRIPEVPIVQSYGGEVKLIRLTEGRSTTRLIQQINSDNGQAT